MIGGMQRPTAPMQHWLSTLRSARGWPLALLVLLPLLAAASSAGPAPRPAQAAAICAPLLRQTIATSPTRRLPADPPPDAPCGDALHRPHPLPASDDRRIRGPPPG